MCSLVVDGITKSYKKRPIVRGVSLSVTDGEIVGLLGPNGAGKTTCFYMVAGLIKADQGCMRIGSVDFTHFTMPKRAKLGLSYLPQESSIFRGLNVQDNIRAILQFKKGMSRVQIEEESHALMVQFGIESLADTPAIALSGGERRRLEIARLLALRPRFILLDEPFAGVDPLAIQSIKSIIASLSEQGLGILITDHNVRETLDICNKAYVINDGRVLASGFPNEIVNNEDVRRTYLGDQFQL